MTSCSCWFETDEEFASRCLREREIGLTKFKNSKKKLGQNKVASKSVVMSGRSGTEGKGTTSTTSNWSTIGQKKPAAKQTPKQSAPSSGFAAAFGGDSDEET